MTPTAEIQLRQAFPHCSAGLSICRSKRIDAESGSSIGTSAAKAETQLGPNAKIPIRNRIMLPSFL
jgi:hypothetical protein